MSRRTSLAALVLALWPLGLRAAVVAEVRVYSAPSPAWAGAIGGLLGPGAGGAALGPGLAPLTAPGLTPGAGYAPVVAQLQGGLALSPKAFAALPLAERRAALELAVDAAEQDLRRHTYALSERVAALAAPGKSLDKDGRAELYRVVAQLQEIRTQYAPLVPVDARPSLDDAFGRAATRALEIRDALLKDRARRMADALGETGESAPPAPAAAVAYARSLPEPSSNLRKAVAELRANPVGRKFHEVEYVLTGYGFELAPGGSHNRFRFPGLKPQIVPHDRNVEPAYVRSAVEAADLIEALRAPDAAPAPETAAGPPEQVDLGSLAILAGAESTRRKPSGDGSAGRARAAAAPRPRPSAARLAPATPRPAPPPKAEPPVAAPAAETAPAPAPPAPGLRDRLRVLWENLRGPR